MTGSPRHLARLHVVTGKGGTGKTTVAAALALALARGGRAVLLVEVEERQGISSVLGVPRLGTAERVVADVAGGGVVHGLSVEAGSSLSEYLAQIAHLGPASALLDKVGAVDLATSIAPGIRDVLLAGKVFEAVRRTPAARHASGGAAQYDAVVLDAPPTGRITRFLMANEDLANLAKVGPLHHQARSVADVLRAPTTSIHLVTLLEEMPVRETVEGVAELREAGMPVRSVVVNRRRAEVEDDADLHALLALADGSVTTSGLDARLRERGVDLPPAGLEELVAMARDHLARLALEDELMEDLVPLGLPLHSLPEVPVTTGERLDRAQLAGLGALLAEDIEAAADQEGAR